MEDPWMTDPYGAGQWVVGYGRHVDCRFSLLFRLRNWRGCHDVDLEVKDHAGKRRTVRGELLHFFYPLFEQTLAEGPEFKGLQIKGTGMLHKAKVIVNEGPRFI